MGFESLPRSFTLRAKLLSLTLALLLGAGIAACGGDDSSDSETAATSTPTETPTAAPANVDEIVAGVGKNTKKKPKIVKPQGDPPTQLVIKDIVKGTGPKAKPGDTLTMQYVGNSWSTGEQFDASWDRGQAFPFQLGAGMVIPGWDQGMVGMRKGGRRLLIIPPDMGYGPQGSGPIGPNETLVFAVDLEKIG
ncbi:MAG TPA: FKBP-type peptidyl-prolyl cis-trans isomerase [Solirubrobacteraceae bacterium]